MSQGSMTPTYFQELVDKYDRVALTGVVMSGKSLLLDNVKADRLILHTDDLKDRGVPFKESPGVVLDMLAGVTQFIVAGMQVPRALRKGLEIDVAVWVNDPREWLTSRQQAFSDGVRGIFHQWWTDNRQVPVHFVDYAVHEGGG